MLDSVRHVATMFDMTTKHTKGAPTKLNLWTLSQHTQGGTVEVSNRVDASAATALRKCLVAELLEVTERGTLRLTEAGKLAIAGIA